MELLSDPVYRVTSFPPLNCTKVGNIDTRNSDTISLKQSWSTSTSTSVTWVLLPQRDTKKGWMFWQGLHQDAVNFTTTFPDEFRTKAFQSDGFNTCFKSPSSLLLLHLPPLQHDEDDDSSCANDAIPSFLVTNSGTRPNRANFVITHYINI